MILVQGSGLHFEKPWLSGRHPRRELKRWNRQPHISCTLQPPLTGGTVNHVNSQWLSWESEFPDGEAFMGGNSNSWWQIIWWLEETFAIMWVWMQIKGTCFKTRMFHCWELMYHRLWTKETALHCFILISGVARTQTSGTGTWEHSYPNIWSASQVYFIDLYYGNLHFPLSQ